MKKCTKCNIEKPLEMFGKHSCRKDGLRLWCKTCEHTRQINWYLSNAKKERIRIKKWRKNKPNYNKQWKLNNPDRVRLITKRGHEKRRNTIIGRLEHSMSTAVYLAVKNNKAGRHWENLVGYTINELKQYLESKFLSEMSWDNYGRNGWVIDHIIPKSFFKYTKPEDQEFQYCWSLDNLQPMWDKDNLIKYNKIGDWR
ncbi:hypothetical protein ACFLQL_00275 [Verrucomicrobiota bacterium]